MIPRKVYALFAFPLALATAPVLANDESLSFIRAQNGDVLITLSGVVPFCDTEFGGFEGNPTFSLAANQISVLSTILPGECSPPPVIPPPQPYSLTINVGALPVGTYFVTWTFAPQFPTPVLPPRSFNLSFQLGGNVSLSVPTLGLPGSVVLALLLAVAGRALTIRSSGPLRRGVA